MADSEEGAAAPDEQDDAGSGTYTARLVSDEGVETVELEVIGGLPQKSIMRSTGLPGQDAVWELVPDSEGYEYRESGIPGADYS